MTTEYKKIVRTELYNYQKRSLDISHLITLISGGFIFLWIRAIFFDENLLFLIYGLILLIIIILVSIKKRVVTYIKV